MSASGKAMKGGYSIHNTNIGARMLSVISNQSAHGGTP